MYSFFKKSYSILNFSVLYLKTYFNSILIYMAIQHKILSNVNLLINQNAKVLNSTRQQQINELIQLYKNRKISQYRTVKNQIDKFINYNGQDLNNKNQQKLTNSYNKLISKYGGDNVKTLGERIILNKKINRVKKETKAVEFIQNFKRRGVLIKSYIKEKAFKNNIICVEVKINKLPWELSNAHHIARFTYLNARRVFGNYNRTFYIYCSYEYTIKKG